MIERIGATHIPGSTGWGIAAALVVVSLLLLTVPLASAESRFSPEGSLPRHPPAPSSLAGFAIMNSSVLVEYLIQASSALASDASLLLDRSANGAYLEPIDGGYILRWDVAVPYSGGPNITFEPLVLNFSTTSVSGGGSFIDYLGVEALALDAASAILRGDYSTYLNISIEASRLYDKLAGVSIGGSSYVATTLVAVAIGQQCMAPLKEAVYWLLTAGAEPGLERALEDAATRPYASMTARGSQLGCVDVVEIKRVQVASSYVQAYISVALYLLSLLASAQPVDPSLGEFFLLPLGSQGVVNTSKPLVSQQRGPTNGLGATASPGGGVIPLSAAGISGLRSVESGIAPSPGGMMRWLKIHASWALQSQQQGGAVNLVEAFKSLQGSRYPLLWGLKALRPPKPSLIQAVPRPAAPSSLPGLGEALRVILAASLLAVAGYALARSGVYGALRRISAGLRLAVARGLARIEARRLPGILNCYLYALAVSARLYRRKEPWETPREYLDEASKRLPFKARELLRRATLLYERYRYGGERGLREGCGDNREN